jgi:hypothetical protein
MAKDDLIIMTKQEFAQATTTMIWGYVEIVLKQKLAGSVKSLCETTLESLEEPVDGEASFHKQMAIDYLKIANE